MMCQRIGRPPISTIGFGRTAVSSSRREPRPPASITAFIVVPRSLRHRRSRLHSRLLEMAHPALGLAERMGADLRAQALAQRGTARSVGGEPGCDVHILLGRARA